MALVVQKYGGTSVGSTERIALVADRVARMRRAGDSLVVVVSAMSGVTDRLLQMARELSPEPSEREIDMLLATGEQTTIALLAMALHARGIAAVSLTGAQAGIVTDCGHTRAKIANITPSAVKRFLEQGQVVIVAGFQGQSMEGQITTLGRGGSDLTAIALAAVLEADLCQIYTDVTGVFTADPRVVPKATKLSEIAYDELMEMASTGSKVMQLRSVEFAKKFGVVFEVRSSFSEEEGTIVKEETQSMEQVVVRGVSLERAQAKVTLVGVKDEPGMAAKLFTAIARAQINVDMIVQNVSSPVEGEDGARTDITFTLHRDDVARARRIVEPFAQSRSARAVRVDENVAKLSVVGIGMRAHSGVAAELFTALAEAGINIQMISTSEIRISVVVEESRVEEGARVAHTRFGLDRQGV